MIINLWLFTLLNLHSCLTTPERILELLREHPEGRMATKEISQALNRPVSMVNICLKLLCSSEKIYSKFDGMQGVIYATSETE